MKTSLNRIIILAAAAIVAAATASAKAPEQISTYFLDYLQGNHAPYKSSKQLKASNVDAEAQKVWAAWQKAVGEFAEEKLPELTPLSEKTASAWHLPDSLEPNAVMPFYYGLKGDSVPPSGYPFFLYIHGSGPKDREWSNGLKLSQRFADAPSVYFIPQIPNEGEYYRWWQRAKQFAWERLLRQQLANPAIDPNRIYFFGISEGGYGSQRLGSFYADYLAAAGPMAGGEPLKNAPAENLRNTAFSLRTGDRDFGFYRDKLTRYTARALDSLQALHPADYRHHVELIPGAGHGIIYDPTTPWLKQFSRNPYPKHISWENFEMDGLYRDGFYNIYVDRRSNPDQSTRTYYELDIDQNIIDLKVDLVSYTTTETDSRWGIALDFAKEFTPATSGQVTIYLCSRLVDLQRPVSLRVNGREVFSGKLRLSIENLVNSCARYFDPMRLYPAAITVDLSTLEARQ